MEHEVGTLVRDHEVVKVILTFFAVGLVIGALAMYNFLRPPQADHHAERE